MGFSVAAVVHFATYAGTSIEPANPLFFVLHLGLFPLFFLFVVRLRRWHGKQRFFKDSEPSHWRQLLRYFPAWVIPAVAALFAYTFANFFLSIQHLPDHATTLTPSESLYTVRAFSGHWLFFYAIPTIYFGFVPASAYPSVKGRADAAV
jgi:hypothetical protein